MTTIEKPHGIHAGEHEPDEAIGRVREIRERERRREREEANRILDRRGINRGE